MAKYDVTFSCGHTEIINLVGKVKDRERKIEYFEAHGLCSECWEAQRTRQFEEQNQKAAEEAKEYGLPELTGSEKQVAWAITIRQEFVAQAEKIIAYYEDKAVRPRIADDPERKVAAHELIQAMRQVVENRLLAQTSARFWIDNRDNYGVMGLNDWLPLQAEKLLAEPPQVVPKKVQEQAIEDMTMRPPEPISSLVAEIRIQGKLVTARYPERNEDFRLLLRGLKYTWEGGQWVRKIGTSDGDPMDRATELGVKLLAAGFPARVYDEEMQRRIMAAEYEPECFRWVMKNPPTGKFLVKWWEGDFYSESKRLPGAKWESRVGMLVPKEAFREVLDFAERYQFKLSSGAHDLVEEARAAFEGAMVAKVSVPGQVAAPMPGSRPVLKAEQVNGEIDADLRD